MYRIVKIFLPVNLALMLFRERFIWRNDFILYFCIVKKKKKECFEKEIE